MVELSSVTKVFASAEKGLKIRALHDVSLRVEAGQVLGLLGPNGSGKSTLIKLILGLHRPSSGRIEVLGKTAGDLSVRNGIGYLPEGPYYYKFLTPLELLRFYGKLSGLKGSSLDQRIDGVLQEVGMAHAAKRRLKTFSKGMLQRVGMAQAILHDPELLILDEPADGIDLQGLSDLQDFMARQQEAGKTIILCSHYLSQVERVCSHVAILHEGRLMVSGKKADLLAQHDVATPLLCQEQDLTELRALLGQGFIDRTAAEAHPVRLTQLYEKVLAASEA